MTAVSTEIAGLPKAELHLHIEGTLEPEMCLHLAARNGIDLGYSGVDSLRDAYRFEALQDFLELYYQGAGVLIEERDFHDLTWAYFEKAAGQNILHAEIFFDPQAHTARGVPFERAVSGISSALERARGQLGITSRLIFCILRHLDADAAEATLDAALRHRGLIDGIGLDSSENGHPPGKFKSVFDRARAAGLLAVAHAGEEGPPAYVREALDVLQVSRIDHGNRSLEDAELVRRLAEQQTPLTVCPLSNLCLGGVPTMAAHPLREMLDRGLMATVNSDDPAYFGGYLNENYQAVGDALDLTGRQLHALARNSFLASFLDAPQKDRLAAKVDDYARGIGWL